LTQKVRLQRQRKYDDEIQKYDRPHPSNAPEWSYVDQGDILYDTEIEATRTDEEYVTEHESEQELERGQTSAADDQNDDSEGLVMDDS
jgi:hypothetical protein